MKHAGQKIFGVMTVLVLSSALWGGSYSGGKGTETEPYRISKTNDWRELMSRSADWNKHFILTGDINLAATTVMRME